ncbi:hypothetical protein ISP15_12815 [Dyella jejuensis]|uniref:Response regulatory domain-containing protein n=1 Tax=Dyella jejuensis TaxID=1432009 RepID=A0ABW8JMZ1_9GAMM
MHRRPHLPAILLTGFTTSAVDLEAGTHSPITVLRKPLSVKALAERMATPLDKRR